MKDYSHYSVIEACYTEICSEFINIIKQLDATVAQKRLHVLCNSEDPNKTFIDIAARFNSLAGTKTSAD